MAIPAVKLTKADRDRLVSTAVAALEHEQRPSSAAAMLLSEISRATIIDSDFPLPDVVAPHRNVEIHDNIANVKKRLQLIYPGDSETNRDAISVLSPLGAALIGLSVGDTFEWCNMYGDRHSITVLQA
jgi:regulator of nucleoside diphosphate kinase